jgi:outer membrane protein TolC
MVAKIGSFIGLVLVTALPVTAQELTLEQAVNEARKNNPAIAEAVAYRQAAAYGRDDARADFFPKLAAAYSYTNLDQNPFVHIAGNQVVTNSTDQHHWEVRVSQPLFAGFKIDSRYRLAGLGLSNADLDLRQAELSVTFQVKQAYFGLLMAGKGYAVAQAAEENLASHEADAEQFYAKGLIPFNDLLKTRVARAEALQERERAAARVRSATSTLNIILGRNYDAQTSVVDMTAVDPLAVDLDALVQEALDRRPDIELLVKALEAKDQEMRLSQGDFYPQVELVGKYQQDGDDLGATNNDYTNQHNTSIGVQATWVFFEAGKTRARSAKTGSEKAALEKALVRLQDQVRIQVQQAFLDLQVAEKNIAPATQALDQAREHWRITNISYHQHLTTSTEVLDARTYLTRAETSFYAALYGYGLAQAELELAVGRPWSR